MNDSGGTWHSAQRPLPMNTRSPASSRSFALLGSSRPRGSSFGAGGKSMMFCICAIIDGLVVALRQMHALALCARLVAVEIGGALLELA